jgi:radical SAM superfamily enzyme YgiQ (UPF0313 family)
MRVCLASAPTIAEFDDLEPIEREEVPRIPLGTLCLASALEERGILPEVVDLDLACGAWRARSRGRGDFALEAAELLAGHDAEVYGLSSLCSSYPLTLRIATALRGARPGCRIVLGGPQATASARATLAAFPAVDVVVRGEGEAVLPALLEALAGARDPATLRGLTYRQAGDIRETVDAPVIGDLDALPLPAYHLYRGVMRGLALPLEAGRGCPFSCTFCSTSRFFGRKYRLKSPGRMVRDMMTLHRRYGTRRFELVHDNFTVDRRRVIAFCEAVASTRAGFVWTCSSRTDTLDDELVDVMWSAGCRGYFFGVESGSGEMQRVMNKRLDLVDARERLGKVSRRGMTSAVGFVTGFAAETRDDLRKTVAFFVGTLRHDHVEPQLSLLSPLTGTPVHERHRHELVLDEIVSDMAFQGQERPRADRELVSLHPEVFSSFYSVPTPGLDREELHELRLFLLNARDDLRWLLVAAAQVADDGLEAFAAFRAWRAARSPERRAAALVRYYAGSEFRRDFPRFVRAHLARAHPQARDALRALARYYASIRPDAHPPCANGTRGLARTVHLTRLGCDAGALLRCLRRGGDLSRVPRRTCTLATRTIGGRREIRQVGEEAADLLRLCDGARTPHDVVRAFRRLHPRVGGVPGELAAAVGLETLRRRGFLAVT